MTTDTEVRTPASRIDDLITEAYAAKDGMKDDMRAYLEAIIRHDFVLMDHLWKLQIRTLIELRYAELRKSSSRPQFRTVDPSTPASPQTQTTPSDPPPAPVARVKDHNAGKPPASVTNAVRRSATGRWTGLWAEWPLADGSKLARANRPRLLTESQRRGTPLATQGANYKLMLLLAEHLPNDEIVPEECFTEVQMDAFKRMAELMGNTYLEHLHNATMPDAQIAV